jgi:hypothetical protein
MRLALSSRSILTWAGQLEKCALLLPSGLDSLLDQFQQYAMITKATPLRHSIHLSGGFEREGYASAARLSWIFVLLLPLHHHTPK